MCLKKPKMLKLKKFEKLRNKGQFFIFSNMGKNYFTVIGIIYMIFLLNMLIMVFLYEKLEIFGVVNEGVNYETCSFWSLGTENACRANKLVYINYVR